MFATNTRKDYSGLLSKEAELRSSRSESKSAFTDTVAHLATVSGRFTFLKILWQILFSARLPNSRHCLVSVLTAGITVFAWVALWRPCELLLYEWYPFKRDAQLFRKLEESEVGFSYDNTKEDLRTDKRGPKSWTTVLN